MTPRQLALAVLNGSEGDRGPGVTAFDAALNRHGELSERDRAFTVHLVQGVYRWQIRLDWVIKQALRFPFHKLEGRVLNLLRLSLYQIFFMDRVPQSAAVNEAVKQAKGMGQRHLAGVVNGILRTICRHKDRMAFPDPAQDRDLSRSIVYAYPLWLVKQWHQELGIKETERLLEAGNTIPTVMVRARGPDVNREAILKSLRADGVRGVSASYSPDGIGLCRLNGPIHGLESFQKGWFQVQGEAAQICSHLLGVRPGELILDVCAGLGGKSTHLASLMNDQGKVVALDRQQNRLRGLLESTRRLRITSVFPVAADASGPMPFKRTPVFDRILVDAPCSGLGVISRHPDIKISRRKQDIQRLADLQRRILAHTVPLLRPGGKMLYVTCTISRRENEGVVASCLSRHQDLVLENGADHMPTWGRALIDARGFFRTLPHRHHMEGFFGALFSKRGG